MEGYCNCQSCGMPLDEPALLGMEKDGSNSTIYCRYCYRDGEFTDSSMTLTAMQKRVRQQLEAVEAGETTIRKALNRLPHLSRWLGTPAIHHQREWN